MELHHHPVMKLQDDQLVDQLRLLVELLNLGRGGRPPTGLRWRAISSSGSGHGCKLKGSEVITGEDEEREKV